jgi:hypothetical protein
MDFGVFEKEQARHHHHQQAHLLPVQTMLNAVDTSGHADFGGEVVRPACSFSAAATARPGVGSEPRILNVQRFAQFCLSRSDAASEGPFGRANRQWWRHAWSQHSTLP